MREASSNKLYFTSVDTISPPRPRLTTPKIGPNLLSQVFVTQGKFYERQNEDCVIFWIHFDIVILYLHFCPICFVSMVSLVCPALAAAYRLDQMKYSGVRGLIAAIMISTDTFNLSKLFIFQTKAKTKLELFLHLCSDALLRSRWLAELRSLSGW